jgi:IclR family transcriptional regulator, acetate operon repressor
VRVQSKVDTAYCGIGEQAGTDNMGNDPLDRGTLGTVRNAVQVLQLLSMGPSYHQLTELARQAGMSLPTIHRLLKSLAKAGFVEQHSQSSRYSLGAELARLSERYLGRHPVLRALAPYLVELRNRTKATILVALLVRGSVVYVDRVDGEDVGGVYRQSHRSHSALETAAGRVLLAQAGDEAWDEAVSMAIAEGATPEGKSPHEFTYSHREQWARKPYLVLADPQLSDFVEVAVRVTDQRDQVRAALAAMARADAFADEGFAQRLTTQLLRAAITARQAMNDV